MINQEFMEMIKTPSVIRELAVYAGKRGQEIGYENVFNVSRGNNGGYTLFNKNIGGKIN